MSSTTHKAPAKSKPERQQYINNMLVEESLKLLPTALEHQDVSSFMAFLRENLPQNSAITRLKYAEYIAYRYSFGGKMNIALASFLRYCPHDSYRREVLWFETVTTMPPLRELSESWLSKLSESGATRKELIDFLLPRIGGRNPDKIATEAVGAIRKFGHLKSDKPAHYLPIWTEPPLQVLIYVLSRLYPEPAVIRMEQFKANTLWQALLWQAASLERIILEGDRAGAIAAVTKLDRYYQFSLEGSGEKRLNNLLHKWKNRNGDE